MPSRLRFRTRPFFRIAAFAAMALTAATLVVSALASAASAAPVAAPPLPATDRGDSSVPNMYAAFEAGQFVRYKYRQEDFGYAWRNRAYLNYGNRFNYSDHFHIEMGLGAYLWYNSFPKERNNDVHNFDIKRVSLYISDAQGTYAFGNAGHPLATATAGVFPYKYNPEARNLGEYLFRSGAYPNFILGDFDFPLARLTGFKVSSAWFPGWKNDLLLTTETDIAPHFDWTLSYLTQYDVGGFLQVGAGIALTNLISVDSKLTNPKSIKNMYVENLHSDSATLPGTDIKYEVVVGDTGYYTFKSTKLMARATVNPQALFNAGAAGATGGAGGSRWLAKDDLKLYGELAILGWKDYPRPSPTDTFQINSFYTDRMERMPVMFGFNVPTFRLLDLLSVELEWYGLKGPDSYQKRKEEGVPSPQPIDLWIAKNGSYTGADYAGKDDWKWSVYARKSLVPGCNVVAQAARDHVRHDFDSPVQLDREEALTRPDQWWWTVKIEFTE